MGYTPTNWLEDGSTPITANELNRMEDGIVRAMPTGGIIMWSGSVANIPNGWELCDGNNGTPDLRNRFVVGAGDSYNPDDTGGASSVTLTEAEIPSHTHGGSVASDGAHSHTYRRTTEDFGASGNYDAGVANPTENVATSTDGAHTHGLTINNTGGGGAHENRPPYYALCFIMRV